jgi:four helix bundle protein
MKNFKDLDVWQRAARLSAEIFQETKDCREYGFRDQVTRSGLSIPSNIAEGTARRSDRESVQFLSVARGSAAELASQVMIGMEAGLVSRDVGQRWLQELRDIQAMLVGLIKRYRSRMT